ncbi:MAG: carboxypeptidase regulatory-like domain-containing protein [Vicinamibacterales bacterium]
MFRSRLPKARLCVPLAAFLAGACGGSEPASPAPPAAAAPTDKADGPGIIAGTVTFDGTPPRPAALQMESDPKCTPEPGAVSERLVVGSGKGLKNVFVYVKDGLGGRTYAVPTPPVVFDQKGCRYAPHVFGVQAGQTIEITNSDGTLHNVHALPKTNREFNFGQPPKVPAVTRVFDKPEIGLMFRCDVHGWMNAYVNVVSHPFFAVTKDDGTFEIKGLPSGKYTVELWHERLGTQSQSVTVDATTPAKVAASFKQATQ